METGYEFVDFMLRARHAVLGAGSLSVRQQGSATHLCSEIPGTKNRAMIRKSLAGTVGGFVPRSRLRPDLNLDNAHGLIRFLHEWDVMVMRSGFGASFFPVAAIEFVDALVWDEGWRDLRAIRAGVEAPSGFGFVPAAEWNAAPELRQLAEAFAESSTSSANTRQAAWDLLDFINFGEDKLHVATQSLRISSLRALRLACKDGREIPSQSGGNWREMLLPGATGCAAEYFSADAPDPKTAAAVISSHLGMFMRNHRQGACDFYLLWNSESLPIAISAVSVEGDVVVLNAPGNRKHPVRREDVDLLLDAVGTSSGVTRRSGSDID